PRPELMRILRADAGGRLRGSLVVEGFLDLVQAPRSPPPQAVDEIVVGRVARYAFGVANDLFVKRREMLAFAQRFIDHHLRQRKVARRRITKPAQERGLLSLVFRRGHDAVLNLFGGLFPKRPSHSADQRLERFILFVRTPRVMESFDYQRLQSLSRLGGQAEAAERAKVERERFDLRLIAGDDFRPIFIGLLAFAELEIGRTVVGDGLLVAGIHFERKLEMFERESMLALTGVPERQPALRARVFRTIFDQRGQKGRACRFRSLLCFYPARYRSRRRFFGRRQPSPK